MNKFIRTKKLFADPAIQARYLSLLLILLIMRVAIPYLEYLFALFAILSIPLLYFKLSESTQNLKKYLWQKSIAYIPFGLVCLFYIYAFFQTEDKIFLMVRELIVCLFFVYYSFLYIVLIRDAGQTEIYIRAFKKQIIFIAALAAGLGMMKLLLDLTSIRMLFFYPTELYPIGSSLKVDHNFFALGLIIGFVLVLEQISQSGSYKKGQTMLMVLYTLGTILTSSRRGILLMILVHLALLVYWLIFKGNSRVWNTHLWRYFMTIFALLILVFSGIWASLRWNLIKDFRTKYSIALMINDYKSILDNSSVTDDVYHSLWESDYKTDWALHFYGEVAPPPEYTETPTMIPALDIRGLNHLERYPGWQGWMGIRRDWLETDTIRMLRIEGLHHESSLFRSIQLHKEVREVYLSVHLKVEQWNPRQWIEIRAGPGKEVRLPITSDYADGLWHKLTLVCHLDSVNQIIIFLHIGGNVNRPGRIVLTGMHISESPGDPDQNDAYTDILNVLTLDSSSGLVSHDKPVSLDTARWMTTPGIFSGVHLVDGEKVWYTYTDSTAGFMYTDLSLNAPGFYEISTFVSIHGNNKRPRIAVKNIQSGDYSRQAYPATTETANRAEIFRELRTLIYGKSRDTLRIYLRILDDSLPQLVFWKNFEVHHFDPEQARTVLIDTIKNIDIKAIMYDINERRKLINEELTRIEWIEDFEEGTDGFLGPRIGRWEYAIELFREFPLTSKLTGGGLNYLILFRDKFSRKQQGFDYPHNVFLTVLLYSGLIGLVVFFWFMIRIILYYMKTRIWSFFIIWIFIFSYVLFSSNSIFEVPLLTAFCLLPVWIDRINNDYS